MIETDEILNNIDDEFDDMTSAVDPDFAEETAANEAALVLEPMED